MAVFIFTIGLFNLALGYGVALWFERRQRIAVWRQSVLAVDGEQADNADNPVTDADAVSDAKAVASSADSAGTSSTSTNEVSSETAEDLQAEKSDDDVATTTSEEGDPVTPRSQQTDDLDTSDDSVTSDVAEPVDIEPPTPTPDDESPLLDQPIDDSAVDPSSTQAAEQDLTASGDRTEGMDPEHDVLVAAEETSLATDPLTAGEVETADPPLEPAEAQNVAGTAEDDFAELDDDELDNVDELVAAFENSWQHSNEDDELDNVDELVAAFDASWQASNAADGETATLHESAIDPAAPGETGSFASETLPDNLGDADPISDKHKSVSPDETADPLDSGDIVVALSAVIGEQFSEDLAGLKNDLVEFDQRRDQPSNGEVVVSWTKLIQEFDARIHHWMGIQNASVEEIDELQEQYEDLGSEASLVQETSLELTALLGTLSFCLTSAAEEPDGMISRESLGSQCREIVSKIDEHLSVTMSFANA